MEIMRLTVVKRDGSKQEYDRGKIEVGIRKALEKRPVSEEKISKILSDTEFEIQSRNSTKNDPNSLNEITSKDIGKIVLEKIKEIDDVAYLRFASVYKGFKNADSFRKEMEKMET